MATGSDLINLNNLLLTDTFNTWFNRTNEVIDYLNPLQVYDVQVGVTGGLYRQTGEIAGNYNGVVTISVAPGPGIGTRDLSGNSLTIVDFALFDDFGLVLTGGGATTAPSRVATTDEYIVNDVSEGGEGIAKKVQARYLLPPEVDVGDLVINGNLTINGNLSTLGGTDYIASNNLRIEDKQIELAYQQSVPLSLTGVTSGTFSVLGATAYYFTTVSGLTPQFYGHVQSYTAAAAGPTGILSVGALFQDPYGPEDFGATGYMSYGPTGTFRYLYTSAGSITSSFLSDHLLDDGGIVLKGSSGDKSFLYIHSDDDSGQYYRGWMSNVNIGVTGTSNAVISRVFRSYGYNGITGSQFIFAGESGLDAAMYLSQLGNADVPLQFTGGTWRISKPNANKDLVFSAGQTGIESVAELFRIAIGASGTTYPSITTANFARGLNVDQLDGAHASTASAAYTIPVSDAFGRINEDWFNAASLRRRYTITSHGFTSGECLRITTTGSFDRAVATTAELAETIGIVSEINDANNFTVTYKGKITGLTGGRMTVEGVPFVAGSVYFLGATGTTGKMIADPDYASATRLTVGQVRKPMLLAVSETEGLVLNEVGVKLVTPTDELYLPGLVPVGSIYPYAGNLGHLTDEWLLCDGDAYRALDYPALYATIGRTYTGKITFASTGTSGTIAGGSRGLGIGYTVDINGSTRTISAVNSTTGVITVDSLITAGTYSFTVLTNASAQLMFFVPDLRTRYPLGGSTGSALYGSVGLTNYSAGNLGGTERITLSGSHMPAHNHGLSASAALFAAGSISALTNISSGSQFNSGSTGGSQSFDHHTPYTVVHYIIRAVNSVSATILTGHNHDLFYPRYDGATQANFGISGGATAASFRSKIGVYGVADVYTRLQITSNYYDTAESDRRYINATGDTGISGSYQTTGLVQIHNNDGNFEFQGNHQIYLHETGYADPQGFAISARNSAVGDGGVSGRFPIFQSFANNSPATYDARLQNWMYGDLLIYGPGLSSNGYQNHSDICFAVNSLVNLVSIRGGFNNAIGNPTEPPTLKFLNTSYVDTTPIGKITGLTAPTAFHHAANKDYVDRGDNHDSFSEIPPLETGGGDPNSTADGAHVVSITPGRWLITMYGTTDADVGGAFFVRPKATYRVAGNNETWGELYINEDTDHSLPFSITALLDCDIDTITFTFYNAGVNADYIYRVEKIVGVRIGD